VLERHRKGFKRRLFVAAGTGLIAIAVTSVLSGCGNTAQPPAVKPSPTSGDSSLSTTGPTGAPSSSYWTEEKPRSVQPKDMPTEP